TLGGAASAASAGAAATIAGSSAAMPQRRGSRFIGLVSLAGNSDGCGIEFAGADAHGAVDVENEDLAIADLAGVGGSGDRFHHLLDQVGLHRDFDLYLRQEAHMVFRAAIDLGLSL